MAAFNSVKLPRRYNLKQFGACDDVQTTKAPLLISIGPQCAGKTTLISQYPNVVDVNFDDQRFTYERVPLKYFSSTRDVGGILEWDGAKCPPSESRRRIFRATLRDRLDKSVVESEWFHLLSLFSNSARPLRDDVISRCIEVCVPYLSNDTEEDPEDTKHLVHAFDTAVRDVFHAGHRVTTQTFDLFISDSRTMSVRSAEVALMDLAHSHPGHIAWGNTNLDRNTVQTALRIAHESQRPVQFIVWGRDIPAISLSELLARNIVRFLHTGRFIPGKTLARYYIRANALFTSLSTTGIFDARPSRRNDLSSTEVMGAAGLAKDDIEPAPMNEGGSPAAQIVSDDMICRACGYTMSSNGLITPDRTLPRRRSWSSSRRGRGGNRS